VKGLCIRWLFMAGAVLIASYLIEGIQVQTPFRALFAAAVLGILNAFLRPFLLILTLPLNLLTFGLFTLVINAMMLKMASAVIPGFDVIGFWSALLGALVISLVGWIISALVNDRGRIEVIELWRGRDGTWRP